MTIYEKLSIIQQELKAPKNQYNSFGKYHYRSCEDILNGAKPLCASHKTVLILSDTIESIGGKNYIKASATLFDLESETSVNSYAYAREDETKKGMDCAQISGCASSYARKYALNGLFNIDDSKVEPTPDPDAQQPEQSKANKLEQSKPGKPEPEVYCSICHKNKATGALPNGAVACRPCYDKWKAGAKHE